METVSGVLNSVARPSTGIFWDCCWCSTLFLFSTKGDLALAVFREGDSVGGGAPEKGI